MREEKLLEFIESELLNERQNWLNNLKIERGLSKLTLESYERDTRQFLAFLRYHYGNKIGLGSMRQLTPSDLRAFIFERRRYGIDNYSLKRSLSGIRSFLRHLKKHGLVNAADVLGMKTLKKSKNLPRPLSEAQALNLVCDNLDIHCDSWINARDLSILHLLYGCGLRISEALSLTHQDIVNDESSLYIRGKGNKTRIVPLLPSVSASITRYKELCPFDLKKDHPFFRGIRGGPLNPGVFQRTVRYLRQYLGLPETTTPHILRHSFATHLLSNGGDLRSIQDLLGHARLSTTQIYTNFDSKKIIEIYDKSHPQSDINRS